MVSINGQTTATSEETPSFSSDLHTHVWNSHLGSHQDQGMSTEDRRSDEAVYVIARMMPIEVLAVERKQLYEQRSSTPEEQEENKKNMRQDSLRRWQEK